MQDIFCQQIHLLTSLPKPRINKVLQLLDDGATVPFIARYRKELTGSMDEVAIESIKTSYTELQELQKRKATILKAIESQGALTPQLKGSIDNCWNKIILEDLYLPYKKKKKTKAALAREKGLEPLAKIIMAQSTKRLHQEAQRYVSKKVPLL